MRDVSDAERCDKGERGYVAACRESVSGALKHSARYTSEISGVGSRSEKVSLRVAMQLIVLFPHRNPTVQELQDKFGMSRATAFRWRAALIEARGNRHG